MADAPYRFLLRMPPDLGDELRVAAVAAGRSLNAEIVSRLESTLACPDGVPLRRRLLAAAAAAAAVVAAAGVGFAALGDGGTRSADVSGQVAPGLKRLVIGDPAAGP